MKMKRRMKALLLLLFVLVAAVLAANLRMYFSFHKKIEPPVFCTGPNALWVRHVWVGEPHSKEAYQKLFATFKRNHITDAYFHVGPWLDSDGGIPERKYRNAESLIANAESMAPEVRVHAWIGQMTIQGGGPLDLSDPGVQNRILDTATKFLDIGFDGIHYDFEPVYSGNAAFIDLLRKTKTVTAGRNKLLSVASGQIEIMPWSHRIIRIAAPKASIWTKPYFLEVARHADQIAVMLYDTALPADWLYGNYVKQQVKTLGPLLSHRTTLFIGVPTYENNRMGHRPWAENMHTALTGIRHALNEMNVQECNDIGTAVFAEWTTDEAEWQVFRENWIGNERK